ncbi:MAG: universal stress protein [Puniceicoccales bacterium]|nr:universal stress protein [Puniceicoccales bacterium]
MKKVLTCIDGSLYGQICCQYALWFAAKNGAAVDALYVSEIWQYEAPLVADFGGSLGAQPYMGLTAQLRQIEADKAGVLREYVLDSFEKAGLAGQVAFHHRTGTLADCVGEFETGGERPELLIVGKRGEGANMAKAHLGANMERVVRASPLPCFVANREFFEPRTLLFACDGSASANKAVAWYLSNRKAFENAKTHIVGVAAKPGDVAKAGEVVQAVEKMFADSACAPSAVKVLQGVPADVIAAYQQEHEANMLLMGAYGHSRIRRLLIGSTTVELLQRCRIPVILFR